jgi:hypothetical protein
LTGATCITDMPGQARDWNGSGNASRWPGAMTLRYVEVWGLAQSAPALWTVSTACAVAPGFSVTVAGMPVQMAPSYCPAAAA